LLYIKTSGLLEPEVFPVTLQKSEALDHEVGQLGCFQQMGYQPADLQEAIACFGFTS
jgi:hypothetical protein